MKGLITTAVIGLVLAGPAYGQTPLRLQCRYDNPVVVKPVRKDKTATVFVATVRFSHGDSGPGILSTNKHGPCTSFHLALDEQSFEGRCTGTVSAGGEPMAVARTLKINRATGVFEEIYWMGSSPSLQRSGLCVAQKRRLKITR